MAEESQVLSEFNGQRTKDSKMLIVSLSKSTTGIPLKAFIPPSFSEQKSRIQNWQNELREWIVSQLEPMTTFFLNLRPALTITIIQTCLGSLWLLCKPETYEGKPDHYFPYWFGSMVIFYKTY